MNKYNEELQIARVAAWAASDAATAHSSSAAWAAARSAAWAAVRSAYASTYAATWSAEDAAMSVRSAANSEELNYQIDKVLELL